jgi:hypothetical protein
MVLRILLTTDLPQLSAPPPPRLTPMPLPRVQRGPAAGGGHVGKRKQADDRDDDDGRQVVPRAPAYDIFRQRQQQRAREWA